jgi:hypothetical protein
MHLYSDDRAAIVSRAIQRLRPAWHTGFVSGIKQMWFIDLHMTEHLLAYNAMDSIRADNDVSGKCGSILTLDGRGFVIVINSRNSFTEEQTTLVLDIVVKRSKKKVTVAEVDGIAESCAESECDRRKAEFTNAYN